MKGSKCLNVSTQRACTFSTAFLLRILIAALTRREDECGMVCVGGDGSSTSARALLKPLIPTIKC